MLIWQSFARKACREHDSMAACSTAQHHACNLAYLSARQVLHASKEADARLGSSTWAAAMPQALCNFAAPPAPSSLLAFSLSKLP